jgi:shikimate kinase
MPNVFLIGPMGSGKTTVGKRLARLLGLDFYDCDQELERSTGASISLIFDIEGEQGFRERETQLLRHLTSGKGRLLATGGGVVCSAENRRLLSSRGTVVYLKTSVSNQLRRLSQDKNRPLLQTSDREQRLNELALERNALYASLADLTFVTGEQSVHAASRALARAISDYLDPLKNSENTHAG